MTIAYKNNIAEMTARMNLILTFSCPWQFAVVLSLAATVALHPT